MVTEQYKDAIYFSSLFAWHYPNVYKEISDILVYHHIEHGTLLHTKDYWCRDYMPIQWGFKSYIQFRYEPDYLKDKPQYKTNIIPVLKAMSRDMDITLTQFIYFFSKACSYLPVSYLSFRVPNAKRRWQQPHRLCHINYMQTSG